jgi:hypothetical protein
MWMNSGSGMLEIRLEEQQRISWDHMLHGRPWIISDKIVGVHVASIIILL